jgi:hypothetical protein
VLLEDYLLRARERIHDVGFGDLAQLGRATIAIGEHASYYGDNGAIAIEIAQATGTRTPRCAARCAAAITLHDLAIQDRVRPGRALIHHDCLSGDNLCKYLIVSRP